jgi:hypothetical protein
VQLPLFGKGFALSGHPVPLSQWRQIFSTIRGLILPTTGDKQLIEKTKQNLYILR